ncbi:hypothetical protein AAL_00776 [Moelleriella libera RCEF 2490]|uniref:Uncharacterized protein n=1 Tax=Moelleriella libera RCEF 2490 TaxID=1081109 RepID=A0A166V660_9HYPO|nr:hypothetical protein AAL_00776 [Moelleriella libera RCEF 2490]
MRTTRPAALDSTIYSENAPKGGWESSNARGAPESARTLLQGAAKTATTTGMSESYSTHTQLECVCTRPSHAETEIDAGQGETRHGAVEDAAQ